MDKVTLLMDLKHDGKLYEAGNQISLKTLKVSKEKQQEWIKAGVIKTDDIEDPTK